MFVGVIEMVAVTEAVRDTVAVMDVVSEELAVTLGVTETVGVFEGESLRASYRYHSAMPACSCAADWMRMR